jgi:hypothetical protein
MSKPTMPGPPMSYPQSVDRDGIHVGGFAKDHPALVTHPTCCERMDSETKMATDETPEYDQGRPCWRP